MTTQPTPPGQRQPHETDVAFQAFRTYLEQGPNRSTASVARALGKSKTLMDRWSRKHGWVERVRLVESEQAAGVDDERGRAAREAAADVASRHATEMRLHATSLAMIGQSFLKRLQGDPGLLDTLDPETHAKLATAASRAHSRIVVAERLVHGMTTDQPAESMPWERAAEQAARLSDAELDARLAGVDEVAQARERRAAGKKAAS